MRSHVARTGRRILVALEPGDEVLGSIAAACRAHEIAQAVVVTFSGAFRWADLIAGDHEPDDPEAPSAEVTRVSYTEGVGSGTITSENGEHVVHIHVALGEKSRSGAAVAGHLLRAETHYVVEIALDEILAPAMLRRPHPGSSGVGILTFAESQNGPQA
ncbi:PPC domain-containing DNA-binding protein [Microbacterium sp. SORGH_AS_0888]|uniref:PPC domain-containing DNA-binding protein n=1 Tax=Microbacterium sp. SORGH_AS_0888 TaxID=3041791 RepID=UPI0027844B37|nr:DUF296 domain-containing protein [Microbacterium sp. SORGH_AS_0888]MDQ1130222.1 putative DNA-binding protein with PD1-like motif [Microbacterium sp. SORGH_AS_0888]